MKKLKGQWQSVYKRYWRLDLVTIEPAPSDHPSGEGLGFKVYYVWLCKPPTEAESFVVLRDQWLGPKHARWGVRLIKEVKRVYVDD